MTKLDFPRQIGELFQTYSTFLVAGHIRPDCDVLGSQIALGLALQGLGKNVRIWNSDGVPSAYSFLPKHELVCKPPPEKHDFDVIVAIDTANHERLGVVRDRISSHKILINIDHHGSNPRYGDLNWIEPTAAASGELVHELLCANGWAITPSIAANLLAAISTDTGSFQYPSTTPQSLRIAASLMEAGANLGELSRLCYSNYPVRRVRLLQAVLGTLKLVSDERIGILWLTPELYQQAGARREDSEGLIDHIRGINTLLIAIVFEQIEENCIRISLRSKSDAISVDSIAGPFGGGGHPMAAGVTIKGEPGDVEAMVVKAATEAIKIRPA